MSFLVETLLLELFKQNPQIGNEINVRGRNHFIKTKIQFRGRAMKDVRF